MQRYENLFDLIFLIIYPLTRNKLQPNVAEKEASLDMNYERGERKGRPTLDSLTN